MRFTDRGIAGLKTKSERYEVWEDGHTGLGVRVGTTGRKSWIYLYRFEARPRRMTLGVYPRMGLADARLTHAKARKLLEGGADVERFRSLHCPDVAILADVFVKHATPPAGLTLEEATHDLTTRSGADGIIVSGPATGAAADLDDLALVADTKSLPVFVGSGVTAASIGATLKIADGVIVGSATKPDGNVEAPVDAELAQAIVTAAG